MSKLINARFVTEVTVQDPDTFGRVVVEIWKDPESGALFGVDSSYLDQGGEQVPSPFNPGTILVLPAEACHG